MIDEKIFPFLPFFYNTLAFCMDSKHVFLPFLGILVLFLYLNQMQQLLHEVLEFQLNQSHCIYSVLP